MTLSPIPDLTAAVGVPRIAAIEHPQGRLLGRPGDVEGQTEVLRQALRVAETAEKPGTVVELPFEWPESPARARAGSEAAPPIAELLKRKPWLIPRLFSRDVPTGDAG